MSTKPRAQTRPYQAKNGKMQLKPSLQLLMTLDNEGFCLACGETQGGVEPDACGYACGACGQFKVYGGEQLVAMGLSFDAS